jgi:hypothetical protein
VISGKITVDASGTFAFLKLNFALEVDSQRV